MKTKSFLLPLALLLQAIPSLRPEREFFRYERPLTPTDIGASGQSCVPLDRDVFAHAARWLTDLRLYQDDHEVPYVIQQGNASTAKTDSAPALLNLGTQDGHVVFDAHLFQHAYSTLEIETTAKDFVASVEVTGSQSADMHTTIRLGTFTIFDLTSQQLSRSTVLHLPMTNFPYLHFRIDGPLHPSEITAVTVLGSSAFPNVYQTIDESPRVVQHGRQSTIAFDLPSTVPVDRVTVLPAVPTGNFSRDVSVQGTLSGNRWRSETFKNIFRVHTVRGAHHIDEEQYSIETPGALPADTGAIHWVVTIDNGDDPPLTLQTVRLEMRERTLCFDADRGTSYTLYYGDTLLAPPRYDYATLFQPVDHPHMVTLAAERVNPRFSPRPDMRPFTERFRWLFWGALFCVVAALGWVAVRTAGRMVPPD